MDWRLGSEGSDGNHRAGGSSAAPRAGTGNLNRIAIHQVIVEHPGLNLQELADAIGIQRTAVGYHVRRMVRSGAVVTLRQGPHVLHFPSPMPKEQRVALSLLRIGSVRLVAQELHRDPHLTCATLADRLQTTQRTVRRALRALASQGLLRLADGEGRARTAHLHPELRLLLVRWRAAPIPATLPGPVRDAAAPPPRDGLSHREETANGQPRPDAR